MDKLYPYQTEGARWLAKQRRAYLADEMGLGKTVQAVVAASKVGVRRTVVVCPASVQENWRREWQKWGGSGTLAVVSYAKLIRMPVPLDDSQSAVDLVVLDEAHYCKSPGSQRTKAALKLAQRASRAWLLSGTPIPNDVRELYAPFKYLWPDLMPAGATTAYRWMDHFCQWTESEYGYSVWGNKPAVKSELRHALRQVMLRRKLDDVNLDLPPLRVTVQYLDRDPKLAERLAELGALPSDVEHMSTLRRILGEYKAPKVARVLAEELREGADMVVLYHHRATGDVLYDALAPLVGGNLFGFDGSTPVKSRQSQIDGFQKHGGLFLAQQGAAGVGITLTRATEIVLVEPSWSPSENEQAIRRIHRIGQDKPCRARLFAVPESLDEPLMKALTRKTAMVRGALNE